MTNNTAPEISKGLDQVKAPKPATENPSDRLHMPTMTAALSRARESFSKLFPSPKKEDAPRVIDDAVRSGHIEPVQAERLKKKLIQGEETT